MEKLEEKILRKVIENIKKSTKTSWETGCLYDWSSWAKIMRKCINDSASILETLIEPEETEEPDIRE